MEIIQRGKKSISLKMLLANSCTARREKMEKNLHLQQLESDFINYSVTANVLQGSH